MQFLRGVLIVLTPVIYVYTVFTVANDGLDFMTPYLTNVFSVTWSGQISLDFTCYLICSALWVAWRHKFSTGGLVMGVCASVLGFLFFAPYVLWQSLRCANVRALVLGAQTK